MPAVVDLDRALVRIVKVGKVSTHPKADRLDLAMVDGWQVVVGRDEFKEGELAMYAEIDAYLPLAVSDFAHLDKFKDIIKIHEGEPYARIKTIRLRGELSQGLLIKIREDDTRFYKEGENLTQELKVLKYVSKEDLVQYQEAEFEQGKGFFKRLGNWIEGTPRPVMQMGWPSFLKKSDQDRVQNFPHAVSVAHENGELFEESVKLNGTSMTIFFKQEENGDRAGVCSRSNELRTQTIHYTTGQSVRYYLADLVRKLPRMIRKFELFMPKFERSLNVSKDMYVDFWYRSEISNKIQTYCRENNISLAIQGELCGPGIQGNYEDLTHKTLFIYSIYEIENNQSRLLLPQDARDLFERHLACHDVQYIPVIKQLTTLPATMKELLKRADGPLYFGRDPKTKKRREGIVFKSHERHFSFKIISNKHLLENDDE